MHDLTGLAIAIFGTLGVLLIVGIPVSLWMSHRERVIERAFAKAKAAGDDAEAARLLRKRYPSVTDDGPFGSDARNGSGG